MQCLLKLEILQKLKIIFLKCQFEGREGERNLENVLNIFNKKKSIRVLPQPTFLALLDSSPLSVNVRPPTLLCQNMSNNRPVFNKIKIIFYNC